MKRLALICCLLAAPALAETPERLLPEASIPIAVGQTEVLRFQSHFATISVSNQGIVQATAQTDRTLNLFGEKEGSAILSVLDDKGQEIYRAGVVVSSEPGRVVRIYGHPGIRDYTGYYCTETACGRADKELNGARDVSSTTVVTPGGTAITRTFGR